MSTANKKAANLLLMLTGFGIIANLLANPGNDTECHYLKNIGTTIHPVPEEIRKPGKYCVTHNVTQRQVWRTFRRTKPSYAGAYFIRATGPDIELNLLGNTIVSEFISAQGDGINGVVATASATNETSAAKRFWVHNGMFRLSGASEGVCIPKFGPKKSIVSDAIRDYRNIPDSIRPKLNSVVPAIREHLIRHPVIDDTHIRIENLTIEVGELGVRIIGRKNTISDSRIEVNNPKAGIYLFGPKNIIENNIIIFRGIAQTVSAAPIKLHGANGTIIRNNIIIIDGSEPRQAISLIETSNVEVVGNRVYGASDLVRKYDAISSFTSMHNSLDPIESRPRLQESTRRADQTTSK